MTINLLNSSVCLSIFCTRNDIKIYMETPTCLQMTPFKDFISLLWCCFASCQQIMLSFSVFLLFCSLKWNCIFFVMENLQSGSSCNQLISKQCLGWPSEVPTHAWRNLTSYKIPFTFLFLWQPTYIIVLSKHVALKIKFSICDKNIRFVVKWTEPLREHTDSPNACRGLNTEDGNGETLKSCNINFVDVWLLVEWGYKQNNSLTIFSVYKLNWKYINDIFEKLYEVSKTYILYQTTWTLSDIYLHAWTSAWRRPFSTFRVV